MGLNSDKFIDSISFSVSLLMIEFIVDESDFRNSLDVKLAKSVNDLSLATKSVSQLISNITALVKLSFIFIKTQPSAATLFESFDALFPLFKRNKSSALSRSPLV